MTTPTAPGWYDDPDDPALLRYFDGVLWTSHTTTRVSPSAASSTIGRSPEVRPAAERTQTESGWSTGAGQPGQGTWSSVPPGGARANHDAVRLPDGAVLAQWWRRLLARVLDSLATLLLGSLLSLPFVLPLAPVFQDYLQQALAGARPDPTTLSDALAEVALPVTLVSVLVSLVYEVGFLVWRSATPGKMVLGTVVRPTAGAGPVTAGVALRRQAIAVATGLASINPLTNLVGSLVWILDPAWLLWDPRRQTLHDKVADTVVVLRR